MMIKETNQPAPAPDLTALSALAWMLGEPARAQRLLDTTGLTPEQLREGIGDAALLAAALRFLEAYEPDLIACAEAIGASPEQLVAARRTLEQQP
jgi:hypothetical protein